MNIQEVRELTALGFTPAQITKMKGTTKAKLKTAKTPQGKRVSKGLKEFKELIGKAKATHLFTGKDGVKREIRELKGTKYLEQAYEINGEPVFKRVNDFVSFEKKFKDRVEKA